MDFSIRDYKNDSIVGKQIFYIDELRECLCHELNIFHLNIRSVKKNIDELSIFLYEIPERFDIIVSTETYRVNDLEIIHKKGYETLYNEGFLNKNHRVIVLIKETLDFSYNIGNIAEIKALKLEIEKNEWKILTTAIYSSPSTCPIQFNIGMIRYS